MKIGDLHTAKYVGMQNQYRLGQRVDVFENGVKVATFVVEQTNTLEVSGKIVNTYGHKRVQRK